MPQFSKRSLDQLTTCHPDLQLVLHEAIKVADFTVLCGHRTKADQDAAVAGKRSKTPWPRSKHNQVPSLAVDIAPSPIDWSDRERFVYLAGVVMTVATRLGVKLRWGGDWNQNGILSDETFIDLPHYELVP